MWNSLLRFFKRPAARRKPKLRVVPRLEALEDRWVPSAATGDMSLQALLGASFGSPPVAVTQTTSAVATPTITTSTPSQTPATPPMSPPANTGTAQTSPLTAAFTPFTTGGSQTQTVAQFNPSLGQLTGVEIIDNGTLSSDVKVENLDGAASNVSAQVNGSLSLQGPAFQPLVVNPNISENTTLSAFDGTLDFAGSSGHDFGNQSAQASQSVTLSAAENDLSAWVGTGNVTLTESAQSSSTLSGSGNQVSAVGTTASGNVQVIYSYTPTPIQQSPPPASPPGNCQSPPPASPPVSPPSPPASPPGTCTTPTGPGSLAGIVYVDANHSGQYVQGDSAVPSVQVNLNGITLTGQSVSQTTTTASDGSYSFTNLQPGIYTLTDTLTAAQQAQYQPGVETLGNLGGAIVGNQMIVALPQGGQGMCYDFGEDPPLPPPPAPPAAAPPPANNSGPVQSPPPASPPASPPPTANSAPPSDPSAPFIPTLSKRLLTGDGWQSLG